ncbi:MAG: hypothetical protein AAF353_16100 [Pseudomonadota bacterium]
MKLLAIIGSVVLMISPVLADTQSSQWVNVSIEVNGLEQSAELLNQASRELATKISELNPNLEQMSPEQLKELANVIEQANQLVNAIDAASEKTGATIESLKEPTRSLVSETVTSAYQHSVDPALQSIDTMVSNWIIYSVIGLLLLVAMIGFYAYFATRQIRDAVGILKSITEDYEIQPKTKNRDRFIYAKPRK